MKKSSDLNVSIVASSGSKSTPFFPDSLHSDSLINLLKQSVEWAADEVFWIKSNAEVIYANQAACDKLGYSRDSFIGMKLWQWDSLFGELVWPRFWAELKSKKHIEFETQHQNSQGQVFPVFVRGHWVEQDGEELLFAFVTDITEKKQREGELQQQNAVMQAQVAEKTAELIKEKEKVSAYAEELERKNHRYNLAVEGTDVGLWSWDIISNSNYWSPKFFQLLGYQDQEVESTFEAWQARLHPDDLAQVMDSLNRHFYYGEKYLVECRMRAKCGEFRWFRVKGKAEFNDAGQPSFMIGSVEDIHNHRVLESAYQFEQKKFENFVNLAPIGIAINRMADGAFEYVNKEFGRFTGYDVSELNSMDYWQLTPEKYAEDEQEQLSMLSSIGRFGPYQKEYIHRKGHHYPVLLSGVRITGLDGEDYIWSVVQDISEQQQVEVQLREAKRVAESANVAKSQFLATMSHEIRTPMNGILGTLQLLQDAGLREPNGALVDNALMSANSLLDIINDILDFSKIEAKMLTLEQVHFSAREVLNSVVADVSHYASEKPVEVKASFVQPYHDIWVGDPTRIRQVMLNIASNAVKFTSKGKVTIVLSCDSGSGLTVQISDTGIGMSEQGLASLFERFTQADSSTTRKFGGTGLGMTITQNLVSLMKGHIDVESELGKGTHFTVTLPLPRGEVSLLKRKRSPKTVPDLTGLKILIAEDNQINQVIIESIVAKTNASIQIAQNGREALNQFECFKPDLVLMDIQMPEVDGLDACQQMRRMGASLPIIAITANVLLDDVKTYMDSGFDDHLGKPIVMEKLFLLLDKYLVQ